MEDDKMKLNLLERFKVLAILPNESDFATLKIVKDLQSSLGVTEAEFKEFEIVQNFEAGTTKWNEKGKEE